MRHSSHGSDGSITWCGTVNIYPCARKAANVRCVPGRLGKGYGKQEICQRIQEKGLLQVEYRYRTYGDRAAIKAVFYQKVQRAPHFKMTPFQKEFYREMEQYLWHPEAGTKAGVEIPEGHSRGAEALRCTRVSH